MGKFWQIEANWGEFEQKLQVALKRLVPAGGPKANGEFMSVLGDTLQR